MNENQSPHEPTIHRRLGLSLLVGALGVGLCATVAAHEPEVLWRASLLGLIAVWLVTMGATGLVAIGNLTGGYWAMVARPFYLATMRTLPLVVLAFVPLAFALDHIYPWAVSTTAGHEIYPPGKAVWLSPAFVLGRAAGYFVIWLLVAWWLGSVSPLDVLPGETFAMRRAGAASLVILVPTTTFAAFDWVMSLEPEWYSSIFGAILTAAGVAAAHALAIYGIARSPGVVPTILYVAGADDHERRPLIEIYGDLGNLLLAFTMVWAYFTLAQFLIIWSGNLPSEITWYELRGSGPWQILAVAVVIVAFAAPFFVLLSRDAKRKVRSLATVATISLFGYGLYMYWMIVPATYPLDATGNWASLGSLLAIAGFWSAVHSWQLGRIIRSGLSHKY